MKLMLKYMSPYVRKVTFTVVLKFSAVILELFIPYILEYMIDDIAPTKEIHLVLFWGLIMITAALLVRMLNVHGNRFAASTASEAIRTLRGDLFRKTMYLSGEEFDEVSLPTLISRMTSDSYNVQNFMGMVQRMVVRAPILLIGGIAVAAIMDPVLTLVLVCMMPVLLIVILFVSRRGIPMFRKVQEHIDQIVRIMRENITGIRVVKALSRCDYERDRFDGANETYTKQDVKAGLTMALPNTVMNLFLNIGLVAVVIVGAYRVNDGFMKPGVILAFLTYFHMIIQAVMGINRIFIQYSKAGASADRIASVLSVNIHAGLQDEQEIIPDNIETEKSTAIALEFEHVNFSYPIREEVSKESSEFAGGEREYSLNDISFTINKGESLGIIGSTGCGKTTIVNLFMRFYDVNSGAIRVCGKDIRGIEPPELRKRIGVVFQNDTIFHDTLANNIRFGRNISDEAVKRAAEAAGIAEYINGIKNGYEHMAAIKGMNLSGGQRQRLLIARAFAGNPEFLVFDDSSSALDYKTDAMIRNNIIKNHSECTMIVIAQRVSSVKNMSHILVMEEGQMIGYGKHEELLHSCEVYRDIYESQMGELREEQCNATDKY